MFDNIGGKIRTLAVVLCVVGIIASVISGGMLLAAGDNAETIITGLMTLILGCLGSWGGSLLVYGFGRFVENSGVIAERLRSIEQQGGRVERLLAAHQPAPANAEAPAPAPAERPAAVPERQAPSADKWVCPTCGAQNRASVFCSGCGRYRKLKA